MRAKVIWMHGKDRREYGFDREVTIGRDPGNQVVVGGNSVSKHHARISHDSTYNCFTLEDLNSTNGTALDGVRMQAKKRLCQLHVISVATQEILFLDMQRFETTANEEVNPLSRSADTQVEDRMLRLPTAVRSVTNRQ